MNQPAIEHGERNRAFVLRAVRRNPFLTTAELLSLVNSAVTLKTLEGHLEALEIDGKVKTVGASPRHWYRAGLAAAEVERFQAGGRSGVSMSRKRAFAKVLASVRRADWTRR
jgi:predicted transcriptional regulator